MEVLARMLGKHQESSGVGDFADDADDHVYPLHLQDVDFRKLIMVCTLRFDHVLDADKLHKGVKRLFEIGDWKKLGGRLRRNDKGKLEIHVPREYSPKRPAVTFSVNDLSSKPIASHGLASKLPVPTEHTSIQPNPYNLIELGVRSDIPKTIGKMVDRDLPQISLHIIRFQDATLVSISWPHSVMDSLGFKHFLHAWSLVVSGKESKVPPLLGACQDVLLEIENQAPESSREKLVFQKERLTGMDLFLFIVRLVWHRLWNAAPEVRSVFLPKTALERLNAACRQEISDTSASKPSQTEPFDEQATLLAWFARFAASASSDNRPVTILNVFNARKKLSSLLDHTCVYTQNMVGYSYSFLPGSIARGGLGPLVQQHTRHIREQSTEQQCLSFLRTYRRATEGGSAFKLFYGPANAHVVGCNSLVDADLVRTVDFGAAAVIQDAKCARNTPPGAMTCLYYHIMNNRVGGGPDCVYLLGKDHAENLWVTAALPSTAWEEIESTLRKFK